jgi:hypothetical protein
MNVWSFYCFVLFWAYVTQNSPFAYIVIVISGAEVLIAPSIIVASEGGVARADESLDVASGQ